VRGRPSPLPESKMAPLRGGAIVSYRECSINSLN
jgi:hypothetical protein